MLEAGRLPIGTYVFTVSYSGSREQTSVHIVSDPIPESSLIVPTQLASSQDLIVYGQCVANRGGVANLYWDVDDPRIPIRDLPTQSDVSVPLL